MKNRSIAKGTVNMKIVMPGSQYSHRVRGGPQSDMVSQRRACSMVTSAIIPKGYAANHAMVLAGYGSYQGSIVRRPFYKF